MNQNIIVIDDDKKMLTNYRMILAPAESPVDDLAEFLSPEETVQNKRDFKLTTATQGEEGYKSAQAALEKDEPFTVAFVDMRMPPGWNGLQTAKALRGLDERIYIVIVTAFSDKTVDELQEELKHDILLLRKPFVRDEIRQLARNLCNSWNRDRELEEKQLQLIQAHKIVSLAEMGTGVAHNINQPLAFISYMYSEWQEILDEGGEIEPEQFLEDLKKGRRQVERITDVINHMRSFGQESRGQRTEITLQQIIAGTQLIIAERLLQLQIKLLPELSENLPPLYGSLIELERVFLSLMQNSVEAMENDGRDQGREIHISAQEKASGTDGMLEIVFTDNGPGIPEKILPKIFDPFFTTKGFEVGRGLGLSTAHGIIAAHNGKINCDSPPGSGARFVVTLPTAENT